MIPLSSGKLNGILVQKYLFLVCAETSDALNITGSQPIALLIISRSELFIDATFSKINHLGFTKSLIRIYSQNKPLRSPSKPFLPFLAIDKS